MVKVVYRGPASLTFHSTPSGEVYTFLPGIPTEVRDDADAKLFRGKADFEVVDLKKKVAKKLRIKEDK